MNTSHALCYININAQVDTTSRFFRTNYLLWWPSRAHTKIIFDFLKCNSNPITLLDISWQIDSANQERCKNPSVGYYWFMTKTGRVCQKSSNNVGEELYYCSIFTQVLFHKLKSKRFSIIKSWKILTLFLKSHMWYFTKRNLKDFQS